MINKKWTRVADDDEEECNCNDGEEAKFSGCINSDRALNQTWTKLLPLH